MDRLEPLRLWAESIPNVNHLAMVSANQADLEILRRTINAMAEVINAQSTVIEGLVAQLETHRHPVDLIR
jgi:hypothetical protein